MNKLYNSDGSIKYQSFKCLDNNEIYHLTGITTHRNKGGHIVHVEHTITRPSDKKKWVKTEDELKRRFTNVEEIIKKK